MMNHIMKGLSSELSPFEEESLAVPRSNPRPTEEVPRRAPQDRKIAEVKAAGIATVSTVAKAGSTLPPGWVPFDGIPGVSPEVLHQIDFPEFDEDRTLLPDVNYLEMGHPVGDPELKQVDNGQQSATPLVPINPLIRLPENRTPSQNIPQPTQLPSNPRNPENSNRQQQLPQPQLQQQSQPQAQPQQPPQLQQLPQVQQLQQPPQLQQLPQAQQPQQPPQFQPQPQVQQLQQPPQLQQLPQAQQPQQPPQFQPQPQVQQPWQPPQLQQLPQPEPQAQPQQRPQFQPQPQLQQLQQPPQLQQQPQVQQPLQVQGLPNLAVPGKVDGPKSESEKNKGIVVFESAYKERTRRPWPAGRPLPPVEAPELGGRFPPFDSEEVTPEVDVATTQQPPRPQQTTRRTEDSDESGSQDTTTTDILTFCTKEVAVKDSNRMIIACGIDDDVWQPSHCPVGSDCFQVTDSTYRICCFSGGR